MITTVASLHDGFAPLHLLHQKIGGHGSIAFCLNVIPSQMKHVFRSFQRLLQRLVGLVGMGSPLHREAALRITSVGKPVRMNLRLNIAIAGIEVRQIEPEARIQPKQGEMVGSEIHQTLNDSPQPH